MIAAVYVRVSTDKQEWEQQLTQLRKYIEGQGWQLPDENLFIETESGSEHNRPVFKRMLEGAFKHKFDVLVVWALDRLSREGVLETLQYVNQFKIYNVKFVSYTEPLLNTLQPELAEIIYAVLAFMAKLEKIKISERTKAGLERARAKGKQLGRKLNYEPKKLAEIQELHAQGLKDNRIGKLLGMNAGSVAYARKVIIPRLTTEQQTSEQPATQGS